MSDAETFGAPLAARPTLVVRATARPWPLCLAIAALVLFVGSTLLLTERVEPGTLTTVFSATVLAAFAVMSVCAAAITFRWRTSVRCDGRNIVVRDPLGARVVSLHDEVGFVRWLDPRSRRPVIWVSDRQSLVAPLSPLLNPLQIEAFAIAVGVRVNDLDDPPRRDFDEAPVQ